MPEIRLEHDSMGDLEVPAAALYGASTRRAVENFSISGQTMDSALIHAYGLIKESAAIAKESLGIGRTVREICAGRLAELGNTADSSPPPLIRR